MFNIKKGNIMSELNETIENRKLEKYRDLVAKMVANVSFEEKEPTLFCEEEAQIKVTEQAKDTAKKWGVLMQCYIKSSPEQSLSIAHLRRSAKLMVLSGNATREGLIDSLPVLLESWNYSDTLKSTLGDLLCIEKREPFVKMHYETNLRKARAGREPRS